MSSRITDDYANCVKETVGRGNDLWCKMYAIVSITLCPFHIYKSLKLSVETRDRRLWKIRGNTQIVFGFGIINTYISCTISHGQYLKKCFWGIYSILLWHRPGCALINRGHPVFPHRFLLSKGTPRVLCLESNRGSTKRQAGALTIELRLTPPLTYASPHIESMHAAMQTARGNKSYTSIPN